MNTLDIILIGFVLLGSVIGLFRGFFKEAVSTVGLLLAAIVANIVSPYASPWAGKWIDDETVASIVVWAIVFLLTMFVLDRIALLFSKLLNAICLGWINTLLGGLLGMLKYCVIAALLLSLIEFVGTKIDIWTLKDYMKDSQCVPYLHDLLGFISPWAKEHLVEPVLKVF